MLQKIQEAIPTKSHLERAPVRGGIVYHRHSLHGLRTSYLLSEYENDLGLLTVVPLCGEESAEWGRSREVSGEVSNAKIGEGKWGTAKDMY